MAAILEADSVMALIMEGIFREFMKAETDAMVVPAFSAAATFAGIRVSIRRLDRTAAFWMTPARGLLISWAIPAARPPTEIIFSF